MEVSFPAADKSFRIFGNLTLPGDKPDGVESTDVCCGIFPRRKISTTPSSAVAGTDDVSSMKPVPVILMVAGSGPIDRNGNVPGWVGGMQLNTHNRFVEHIVSSDRPVAVLSYDKRGVGKSLKQDDADLYHRAGMHDLVSDAVQAVKFLANHPRIDETSITLLGHSEGAIIAPLICQKIKEEEGLHPIKACIFLGGFGMTIADAMAVQQQRLLQEVKEETGFKGWMLRKMITKEKIEQQYNDMMKKVDAEEKPDFATMSFGMTKIPAKWLRESLAFDGQHALAEHVSCHCLAITGCKDMQVRDELCDPEKAKALAPKALSMESHRPANLTHVLRSMDGPPKMLNLKTDYARMAKLPLDPELLSLIGGWCDRILLDEK